MEKLSQKVCISPFVVVAWMDIFLRKDYMTYLNVSYKSFI